MIALRGFCSGNVGSNEQALVCALFGQFVIHNSLFVIYHMIAKGCCAFIQPPFGIRTN